MRRAIRASVSLRFSECCGALPNCKPLKDGRAWDQPLAGFGRRASFAAGVRVAHFLEALPAVFCLPISFLIRMLKHWPILSLPSRPATMLNL